MNKALQWTIFAHVIYLLSCAEPADWLERAKTDFEQEDYLGTIVNLNAHLALGDTSCDALVLRAASFRRVAKLSLAVLDLERADELYPGCYEADVEYAGVLMDLGDTARAHRKLIQIQHIEGPVGSDIQIEFAKLAYKQDRFHAALLHLDRAVRNDSNNHLAWYYRGYLQSRFTDDDHSSGKQIMDLFNFDKALNDFTHCLAIDSLFADAWYQRGMVYLNRFDTQKGLSDVARSIRLKPEYSYYYTGRAEYFMREKKYILAKKDLEKAIELNPVDTLNSVLLKRTIDSIEHLRH